MLRVCVCVRVCVWIFDDRQCVDDGNFTFREQLAYNMKNTTVGRYYLIGVITTAVVSICLYVVDTYRRVDDISFMLHYLDVTLDSFFLCDFILFLYIADDRVEHMMSSSTWADLASVLPLLSIFVDELHLLGVFRFFRCTRIIKLYRLKDEMTMNDDRQSVAQQTEETKALVLLIFTASAFVFVSAGIVHAVDYFSDAQQFKGGDGTSLQFHEAFYFLIVTITTVGYGDIYPDETMSRCQPLLPGPCAGPPCPLSPDSRMCSQVCHGRDHHCLLYTSPSPRDS